MQLAPGLHHRMEPALVGCEGTPPLIRFDELTTGFENLRTNGETYGIFRRFRSC